MTRGNGVSMKHFGSQKKKKKKTLLVLSYLCFCPYVDSGCTDR